MAGCNLLLTTGDELLLTSGDFLDLTTTCVELGIAVETDTALPLALGEDGDLGLATETDTGLGLTVSKVVTLGIGSESDSGLPLVLPVAPVSPATDSPGSGPSGADRAYWDSERERLAAERALLATQRDDEDVLLVLT